MMTETKKKIMLSAIQPSNKLTLGNYLGAVKNWVSSQKNYDCIFFAVDLHTITVRQDPKELRESTYRAIATYIAAGIDPETALLFVQSHVRAHAELGWILNCYSYMGELNRMTQFKDKSSKQEQNVTVGLYDYPVLMASDILLYQSDLIPVGEDQKQHVELTRDIALRMNNAYGKDLFTIPEPFIPKIGGRIMSLQNPEAKMSKSDPDPHAAVFLSDTNDQITKKFKRAVTDSGSEITDDPAKAGVRNLLTIQSAITGKPIADIVEAYRGKQYGHLKVETAEIVVQAIGPIRDRAEALLKDLGYLDSLLRKGAERAAGRAEPTLKKVFERIGFVPR